jgi:hypothetical protein
MEEAQFPIGAKVQLKHEFGDVYVRAWGGSIGWIKDTKTDQYGFDRVFITWDKNDWRWNNAVDGWTYASHFTLLELPTPTKKPSRRKIPLVVPPEPDSEMDEYMAELQKAMEAIAGSEGFAIFVAKRVPVADEPNQSMVMPEVFAASHSGEADAVLGIMMSEHLSETFQDMTMLLLEMYSDHNDDDNEKSADL